ncbi:MAG: class I SAM-dependent methyltransferase [Planctomycetota bacterium]
MPSIETNRANWDNPDNWRRDGDEWSDSWGGTPSLWFGSILPRLWPLLPASHLLEIACGHGRITQYLLGHCERYTGVDLVPACVAHCQQRFAGAAHARFLPGDGSSLAGIADNSIDLAFSWDSLVHAERDAVSGYVRELARVLAPGGNAWLHHSNLGAFVDASGTPTLPNPHWRASSVSAALVRDHAAAAGLAIVAQEILQCGEADIDCITLLSRLRPGEAAAPPRLHRHPDFALEMRHLRQLAAHYSIGTRPAPRA